MTANARETALRVLRGMEKNGAWADASLKAELAGAGLSAPDAALCSRIVYGVTQNKMLLDYYLSACCTQKISHLQPPLLHILRIGAYQILFLDRVPDRAAVDECVRMAKNAGRAAASGLVNAVLRRLSQNKTKLPALPDGEVERLSVQYSHPAWLVERLLLLLGSEETEAFLHLNNDAAPMTVQVNPLRTEEEALLAELSREKITARRHPWLSGCLEISGTGDLSTLPAFYQGKFTVQDAAARLVSLAAELRGGESVLDVCAAPGGKSFSAAFSMQDKGRILACDLHENKLRRIQDGARRLQLSCIETACADGSRFCGAWENRFDVVLCDVPCSGLGIIRKKPDVRYKAPDELAGLARVQRAILENSARYVKEGGLLLYSTCTILPEENEQVTDGFLAAHGDFTYESFALPALGTVAGRITLWPQRHGTDGFYISRMRRKAGASA